MSTKIQINSLEALERLIGNDNELEIEVRNTIIQKFAEKHLKPLANSDAFNQIKRTICADAADQLNREIATFKSTWGGSITDVKINSSVKTEIDRQVRLLVDDKIREAVHEAVQFWATDKEIKARIAKSVECYNEQTIREEVRKRFDEIKKNL